jgi:transposase
MLDAKILINEVLPYLSLGKMGKGRELDLLEIVQAIFHRLKTGCQWRELPVKQFISRVDTTWNAVYYHFHKWCGDGSWEQAWTNILDRHKHYLDMSCVNLDGSHTRAFRGGQAVGYQGRKHYKSTNMLFIIDNQGIIVFCSEPISGQHHDVYNLEEHWKQILQRAKAANIDLSYLFINADAGFDDATCRRLLEQQDIEANIAFNKRNGYISDREEYLDEELYKRRAFCEHPFAWMDAFKGLLVRYETLAANWLSMNIMGMIHLFLRRIRKHIIENY